MLRREFFLHKELMQLRPVIHLTTSKLSLSPSNRPSLKNLRPNQEAESTLMMIAQPKILTLEIHLETIREKN